MAVIAKIDLPNQALLKRNLQGQDWQPRNLFGRFLRDRAHIGQRLLTAWKSRGEFLSEVLRNLLYRGFPVHQLQRSAPQAALFGQNRDVIRCGLVKP